MGFSLPYIFVLALLLLLSALQLILPLTARTHKIIVFFVNLIFLVFFGLRGFVQTDFIVYSQVFEEIPLLGSDWWVYMLETGIEPLFLFYTSLLKMISENYHVYVFLSSAIDLCLLYIVFRRYLSAQYYAFFIAIFIVYSGVGLEFNLMRNIKSLLFFLISIRYIEVRDFKRFFILNLIGTLFHWSSFVYFPLYFFIHREMKQTVFFVLLFISLFLSIMAPYIMPHIVKVVGVLFGGVVEERMNTYLLIDEFATKKIVSFGDMERLFFAFVISFSYNRLKNCSKSNIIWLNLYAVYMVSVLLSTGMVIILARFSILFIPACWILYTFLLQTERKVVRLFLFSLFAGFMFFRIYTFTHADVLNKYDNILLDKEIISYEERIKTYEQIFGK